MTVAQILKNLRTDSGLTQKELSEILGIGQATIACYENGLREPHIANLIAYADYFECSVDFLIGRADDFGNLILDKNKQRQQTERISNDEQVLLEKYRNLNSAGKARVSGYIDGLNKK